MSVVAAVALPDRVLVTADCRLTTTDAVGKETYYDHTLKLFVCGPLSVIGFVGDVRIGAPIVQDLLGQVQRRGLRVKQLPKRHRVPLHPNSLHSWLPRFLRNRYAKTGSTARVDFLVASVIPGVASVVSRTAAYKLVMAALEKGRNTGAQWAIHVLLAGQKGGPDRVALMGTFAPRILIMESPLFVPTILGPLSIAAIGSGGTVTIKAAEEDPSILLASDGFEEMALDTIVGSASARAGVSTVGGLRPTYEISRWGVKARPCRVTKGVGLPDEEIIELACLPDGSWTQRNVTAGVEVEIVPPWNAIQDLPPEGKVFGTDFV